MAVFDFMKRWHKTFKIFTCVVAFQRIVSIRICHINKEIHEVEKYKC